MTEIVRSHLQCKEMKTSVISSNYEGIIQTKVSIVNRFDVLIPSQCSIFLQEAASLTVLCHLFFLLSTFSPLPPFLLPFWDATPTLLASFVSISDNIGGTGCYKSSDSLQTSLRGDATPWPNDRCLVPTCWQPIRKQHHGGRGLNAGASRRVPRVLLLQLKEKGLKYLL